ncbi:hypothetical protein [Prochlorococcus sp. MIT 0916]|uniref:hypothetical protein n=1 Tax=Prochlorococcus sp. MIT 0916 TaxID=3082521 RepID=UPI0039B57674
MKATPFLTTFFLILFLCLSNQKENTKLRLLIWDTPSLGLGTYLAISTGTGFIISYFVTTNLARGNQSIQKHSFNFKNENKKNYDQTFINESEQKIKNTPYDNTLIERDIKDPLPTLKANFRIIGSRERSNKDLISNDNIEYYDSNEFQDKEDEKVTMNGSLRRENSISSDWFDESYSNW